MFLMIFVACLVDLPEPDDSAALDTGEAAQPVGACLAAGGSLVERAASEPWAAGLADLEVDADGTIWALDEEGHLLRAEGGDPTTLTDLGATGAAGGTLDEAGGLLLASAGGARYGEADADPAGWSELSSYISGPMAISPDGATVAYTFVACGIDYGLIDTATGRERQLDDVLPVGFEYLEDGGLVAVTLEGSQAGLRLYEDDETLSASWTFSGPASWHTEMAVLGSSVVLATLGDGDQGTLERVDVSTGAQTSTTLPFDFPAAVAVDPQLSWALSAEGDLYASDGETGWDLGDWSTVQDLVAAPDGTWVAMAGTDGTLRVYGCE